MINNKVILLLVLLSGLSLQASAQSQSWKFDINNNEVIKAQRDGGVHESNGKVVIDYFGHNAFRITSPRGLTVLVDPWRNDPSGAWGLWFPQPFPAVTVDIVLSTHAHFDHDAVYRPHAVMVLERLAGRFSLADMKITGLADKHQCHAPGWYHWTDAGKEFDQRWCPPDNPLHMDNFIQVIDTGGLRIVVWGDNRPDPAEHVINSIKNADVLILPIDGSHHILSDKQVNKITEEIQPHVIIPAHYYLRGVTSVLSTLRTADEWVAQHPDAARLNSSQLVLQTGEVKKLDGRVYYFGDNFTSK